MPQSTFTPGYASMVAILVALRKSARLTQTELSGRLGKPQPFISNIERCVRRIDVIEFYAIVTALGGEPEAVFRQVMKALPKKVVI